MEKRCLKNKIKCAMSVILVVLIMLGIWMTMQRPSHNRVWEVGQEELPHIKISNNDVEIENFRDFVWKKMQSQK